MLAHIRGKDNSYPEDTLAHLKLLTTDELLAVGAEEETPAVCSMLSESGESALISLLGENSNLHVMYVSATWFIPIRKE